MSSESKQSQVDIKENFDFAVEQVYNSKPGSVGPTNEERLQFYALYKQATVGKCNILKPWAFQVVQTEKWNAWNNLGNMSSETAMLQYCDLYMKIYDKYTK